MSALTEMTVDEAASKALEILMLNSVIGYDSVEDLEADFLTKWTTKFSDSSSAWDTVKGYSNSENTIDGLTASKVAAYGGEGEGEDYWVVVSLSDGTTTRYFRKDGYYESYGAGGALDGETYEVKPVERLVTFYENV